MKLLWRFALLLVQIAILTVLARGEVDFVYRAF